MLFPALKSIGGLLSVDAVSVRAEKFRPLTRIHFPVLSEVQAVSLRARSALSPTVIDDRVSWRFDALSSVNHLSVSVGATQGESFRLDFPLLETVGELVLEDGAVSLMDMPQLRSVERAATVAFGEPPDWGQSMTRSWAVLPALEYVGGHLRILGLSHADEVSLPSLREASSLDFWGSLEVFRLSLGRLEVLGRGLSVGENRDLEAIDAPKLRSAPSVVVQDNPRLPECVVRSLVEQLQSPPVDTKISDNAADCPPGTETSTTALAGR